MYQWQITPNTNVMGATLSGIDLTQPMSMDEASALKELLWDHQLLISKRQSLTPVEQEQWASSLGPLRETLPEQRAANSHCVQKIIKNAGDQHNFGGAWHADGSFMSSAPRATIIYSVEVPPSGGDTLFGDCVKAYRSLSMGMKMLLSDLSAIHLAHGIVDPANFNASSYVERASSAEQVSHPVVGVHPTTHKKYLYVNQSFTKRFVGMTLEESAGLLDYLVQQVQKPEMVYRHQWEKGDVVLWDNRTTQHCALNDYHGHRRVMHRTVVLDTPNSD